MVHVEFKSSAHETLYGYFEISNQLVWTDKNQFPRNFTVLGAHHGDKIFSLPTSNFSELKYGSWLDPSGGQHEISPNNVSLPSRAKRYNRRNRLVSRSFQTCQSLFICHVCYLLPRVHTISLERVGLNH